jgi:hypothetical protein
MSRKLSPKHIGLALVPAVAGMGFVGLDAQAASAADLSNNENVNFTDGAGSNLECDLVWSQNYDPNSQRLEVSVSVSPTYSTDTGCLFDGGGLGASVATDTTFRQNSDGTQVEHFSSGDDFTDAVYTGVKNAKISTTYTVQFLDCNSGLSQCSYSFSLSQGK